MINTQLSLFVECGIDVKIILKKVAESDSIVRTWEKTTYGDIKRILDDAIGKYINYLQ